ncbi:MULTISPECIES: nuclear transport factor 2 family protein [unclassified Sphingobium]|uniref:nuclear transport factor 2 family protein n=1 Tax=unclassified Sphingobium TaxID=2611147 RepID=UPI00222559BC|nr:MULTISPECIES: nuclear transport factor 2 family protein [unclassified Sphingobium]MCW2410733.1 ketosteroid isomerase-like protein [Sphingobium sp. B8D3D]MCW2416977.1 ketosteroid isomerase-like protein [Sphingobium sp. B8D3A]
MTIDLPDAIASYFAADETKSAERVAQCFTETAIVTDEGETYSGREAIQAWKASSSTKYSYTVEPFSIAADGDRLVVTGHLEGDFPGSPIDLRYIFVLDGEKIAALEIVL